MKKSLILFATLVAGVANASGNCTDCRSVMDKTQYLACMKACLSDAAPETASKAEATSIGRQSFARRAVQFDWETADNTDTMTNVTTVTASKTAIEPLRIAEQAVDVTLVFSANTKSEGGLYLKLPSLDSTRSLPFLSVFGNVAADAVFGASVTARIDKNPAIVLPVLAAQGGVYLKGCEALLSEMTTGSLLTVRLSGTIMQDKDIYFDLRGFADAAQWVQLGVGGIKQAPSQLPETDASNRIQELFNIFFGSLTDAEGSAASQGDIPSDKSSRQNDLMRF